jgi:hypothetical protein
LPGYLVDITGQILTAARKAAESLPRTVTGYQATAVWPPGALLDVVSSLPFRDEFRALSSS